MESLELARIAANAADDKKGVDIVAQCVSEQLKIVDYFVIVTANSRPQLEAIVDEVVDQMREKGGVKPIGIEGQETGEWVLVDFGSVILHVFKPELRDFYRLETLWGDAPIVDLIEAPELTAE